MHLFHRFLLSAFGFIGFAVSGGVSNCEAADSVRFNRDIRPILTAHCAACHGGVRQAGDVSFVYRDKVLPPDGWIVEPGDPDASVIMERITSTDPDLVMPPPEHGKPLDSTEVDLIREWIEQGAVWEEHWAYQRPEHQELPEVSDPQWVRSSLDAFILQRLDAEGITPAPEASPLRRLRRVSLDLTGLPPSPEDRARFLSDLESDPSTAYEAAVDRLLGSPAFGERWAAVWLDQVRYADSKGLGIDGRRNIWKYRDWVISAFNRDMPYDEFTVRQIAGDLLPDAGIEDRIATAAHRLTQSNEEGGTDDEEFRVAAVLDRVSTTWQTWQGITFGCVQCHSHPYGPFEHREFYEFAAFFNNTSDCDLNEEWPVVQAPVDPKDNARADELDRSIFALRKSVHDREYAVLSDTSAWTSLKGLSAVSGNETQVAVESKPDHDEFRTVGTVSSNTDITLEAPVPEHVQTLTAVRLTAMPLDPVRAVSDSEWGFVLSHIEAALQLPDGQQQAIEFARVVIDEPDPFYDPQQSLNAKSRQGFAAYTRINYPRQAAFVLKSPVSIPAGSQLRVVLKHRVFILASFSLITRRGHLAVSDDVRFTELLTDPESEAERKELAELERQRKSIRSTAVPVLAELPDHLRRPTHVFVRGLFLTKDEQVRPGVPASLPPLNADGEATRLDLARWLVSPENPLTARVHVNRIWARIFGTGLVATEEDFGSSGERPSHPELLDFLALRFQNELGWSTKSLLRELVLSSAYRQSSAIRPELQERDGRNRLLARGPRNRLSAEVVRDQALAVSGLLSSKQFGPPVHPPIPDGVWRPFSGGDKWSVPEKGHEDRYRRSIYTYTKRSIPFPMFAAFDAPSREFCTPRRLTSNTPLQALMTLNDAAFAECSEALASLMASSSEDVEEQIRHGFVRVLCREPNPAELRTLTELCEAGDGGSVSRLRSVAVVLLNLDEFVTK